MSAAEKTIDATPTWSEILDLLIHVIENGSSRAKKSARLELSRMAQLADREVARQKEKISG